MALALITVIVASLQTASAATARQVRRRSSGRRPRSEISYRPPPRREGAVPVAVRFARSDGSTPP